MRTKTMRCGCGRLHQIPDPGDQSEIQALEQQLLKGKKLLKQARQEIKELEGLRAENLAVSRKDVVWYNVAEGLRARTEAALAKVEELREQGNDGDYGEGMYDGLDAVVEALKGGE